MRSAVPANRTGRWRGARIPGRSHAHARSHHRPCGRRWSLRGRKRYAHRCWRAKRRRNLSRRGICRCHYPPLRGGSLRSGLGEHIGHLDGRLQLADPRVDSLVALTSKLLSPRACLPRGRPGRRPVGGCRRCRVCGRLDGKQVLLFASTRGLRGGGLRGAHRRRRALVSRDWALAFAVGCAFCRDGWCLERPHRAHERTRAPWLAP